MTEARRFLVLVNGENVRLLGENETERLGFYSTVFLDAADELTAESVALQLVMNDLRPMMANAKSEAPTVIVDKVEEVQACPETAPRLTGYTWYVQDDEEPKQ